jgi:hypothetical protein
LGLGLCTSVTRLGGVTGGETGPVGGGCATFCISLVRRLLQPGFMSFCAAC